MKESFLERAKENILAAEILYGETLLNAATNRAYYAAFHAAIYAIYAAGKIPQIDHKTVQTLFTDIYFNRRKVLPSKFKGCLTDLQDKRNSADYRNGVGKKMAAHQLAKAQEFINVVIEATS